MNISVSAISSALRKTGLTVLSVTVALFLSALLVRWGYMLASPAAISHNNPFVMALAFATLYFGTGAYLLRQQFIQMAGVLRHLAGTEIHFHLPQIFRAKV